VLVSFVWWQVAVLDAIVWTSWAMLAGWWHRRASLEALRGDGCVLRLRGFEQAGTWYERRLRIKAWKDRLPETGGRHGMSKRRLPGATVVDLGRFGSECARGERTHWTVIAAAPTFALWNPHDLFLVAAGTGIAGNTPFIVVLRYNRARIAAIVARRTPPACGPSVLPRLVG
jgi:glycosyl-4,4'-diaponeurosporenoate acyltransferase